MATEDEITKLAESLKANGLAASDRDAIAMAERMLGVSKTPEQRFEKSEEIEKEPKVKEVEKGIAGVERELQEIENKKEEPINIKDIEPVERKEIYDITKDNRIVKELIEKGEELEKENEENEKISGFKEIPVGKKKKKPTLTEEEKRSTDLTKWFYYGKK